ncbi:MAG: S8 family serine peptidase, partial [Ilumatobacteraceae bacterium]
MKLRTSKSALLVACATMAVAAAPLVNGASATPAANTDDTITATVDSSSALVVLTGEPVATAKNMTRGNGTRVNLNGAATKSYRAKLSSQRNAFRKWLQINAPTAQITGQFDIALNAVAVNLNGTSLDTIRRSPQVVSADFQGLYYPTDTDPDLALINAVTAWGTGGEANAGSGVQVAIIDSGIEATHTCFDDMGDNTPDDPLTNNKVIVAKVFYNKAKVAGLTAAAVGTHGTHVAGTVACDFGTPAVVDGVRISHTISGVAPAAQLGNYNVFPGEVANARSEDILNALEAAFSDGMDVANMSLGGGAHGARDLLTVAVDNLDLAGMVVAVSAGNEGPGFGTLGSPGSAERALTAGAATVPHIVTRTITFGAGGVAYATPGEFGAITTGPLGTVAIIDGVGPSGIPLLAGLSMACTPADVAEAPDPDSVAVVARGVCTFSEKIHSAVAQGYAAVIVVNRAESTLAMAGDGTPIPAVMVPVSALPGLKLAAGSTVSITDPLYINPYPLAPAGQMADFSSEGP